MNDNNKVHKVPAYIRVGLYGGMANNMYIVAKAFARYGLNVCFIRDRSDHYPFSQPMWEDVACTLAYDEVPRSAAWSWETWQAWEAQHGWQAPPWLTDPLDTPSGPKVSSQRHDLGTLGQTFLQYVFLGPPYRRAALATMMACDVLLVCGVEGAILALASSRPFVIWPHGGDIRMAAGLHHPIPRRPNAWLQYQLTLRLLRLAYRQALWIGTHDAKGLGGHVGKTTTQFPIELLPIPLPIRPRQPKRERCQLLAALMEHLQLPLPKAKLIGFIPSRIDFFWKGTDRVLRALRSIAGVDIHLILSGWGSNYQEAQTLIPAHQATFLPCAISKPILYDLFGAVDFVVDQFQMGTYGTAAAEAMSCGTPVMMWIDGAAFQARGWEPPPVLNARTDQDIGQQLVAIATGQIDLQKCSRVTHEWAQRVHGEQSVVSTFVDRLMAALSKAV